MNHTDHLIHIDAVKKLLDPSDPARDFLDNVDYEFAAHLMNENYEPSVISDLMHMWANDYRAEEYAADMSHEEFEATAY